MDDRFIATSLLSTEKNLAKAYAMARLEAAHEAGRRILADLGEECYQLHDEAWEYTHNRGWYTVPAASEDMVDQALEAWGRLNVNTGAPGT